MFISLILLVASSAFSQRQFVGKAIEVLDGKTVVIETSTGKLTTELQYIEIPEPENPLNKTVQDHLKHMVLDKSVQFQMHGFSTAKLTGSIFLGDVDIAQQMLRDGAAWLTPVYQSSQSKPERDVYEYNQQLAKNEKRGIWASENLKPAALLRAERQENVERQEQFARKHPTTNNAVNQSAFVETNRREANKRPGKWGDINPKMANIGALYNGYNAETKTGFLTTGFAGVRDLSNEDQSHKMAVDVTYIYKEDERNGRTGVFVFTLDSISKDWRFLRSNDLILTIGEKDTIVGKARRKVAKDGDMVRERLTYEVSRSTIEKMYNGGEVTIKIGHYMIWPDEGFQLLLYNMLQITG